MGIKIITDSGIDLPEDLIKKYNIDVLPLFVLEGEKEYLDKIDIMPEKVLKDMKEGIVYKTAQVTPETFINSFKPYIEKGDTIIYLALSDALSGTFSSSVIAKKALEEEYSDCDINLIDTKAVSGGQGFMVLEVAKMVEENLQKQEILNKIEFIKENIQQIFTIDDIEYLYRGGRVSKTQNIIGGLLGIKPILCVKDGKLEPLEKIRGKNKVLKSMIDIIAKSKGKTDITKQTIIITHADALESAIKLKQMIEEEFGAKEFIINTIGAVIGAHAGPGTLAVFFLKENII